MALRIDHGGLDAAVLDPRLGTEPERRACVVADAADENVCETLPDEPADRRIILPETVLSLRRKGAGTFDWASNVKGSPTPCGGVRVKR